MERQTRHVQNNAWLAVNLRYLKTSNINIMNNTSKIKAIKDQGYQVKIVHWRPVAVQHGYGVLEKTVAIAKRGVDKFREVRDTLLEEYEKLLGLIHSTRESLKKELNEALKRKLEENDQR